MRGTKSKGGRNEALQVLYMLDTQGGHTDETLSSLFIKSGLTKRDKAFITQLVYGVLRWRNRLDWIIERFSNRRLKKISPWIVNILRLGVYQLLFLDKVPNAAAVNESVILARRYGHKGTVSFVNAILREVDRSKEKIDYPDKTKDPTDYLSIFHSHPRWLIERWLKRYDFDKVEKICIANNSIPPLTIRVNTLKTTVEKLKRELEKEIIFVKPCYYSDEGLRLKFGIDFLSLESFKKGLFQVQDEASILISNLLSPLPESKVLDICAAPGGKTTHIAQMMKNRGEIFATDLRKGRLLMLYENCRRLGIKNVKMFCLDATKPLPLKKDFDGILVDAPCSSFGVLRRNPDIKWQKSELNFDSLSKIQLKILENIGPFLKKGGVLVYSICSNEPEESREVIKKFLQKNKDFLIDDPKPYLPKKAWDLINNDGYSESFPYNHEMDGFFGVRLIKKH